MRAMILAIVGTVLIAWAAAATGGDPAKVDIRGSITWSDG